MNETVESQDRLANIPKWWPIAFAVLTAVASGAASFSASDVRADQQREAVSELQKRVSRLEDRAHATDRLLFETHEDVKWIKHRLGGTN